MELVLKIDEGVVARLVELDAAEHRAHDERTHEHRLGLLDHLLARCAAGRLHQTEHGGRAPTHEHVQRFGDALQAEQVVAVGGDVDLVDDVVGGVVRVHRVRAEELGAHLLLRRHLVELDPELEAQLVELLLGVGLAERGEELIAVQVDGRLGREGKEDGSVRP